MSLSEPMLFKSAPSLEPTLTVFRLQWLSGRALDKYSRSLLQRLDESKEVPKHIGEETLIGLLPAKRKTDARKGASGDALFTSRAHSWKFLPSCNPRVISGNLHRQLPDGGRLCGRGVHYVSLGGGQEGPTSRRFEELGDACGEQMWKSIVRLTRISA